MSFSGVWKIVVQLLLPFTAGLFLIISVSVILQVGSFKLTGRRVFRMAPIHHHFQYKGWPESKIVLLFTPSAIYTLDADGNVSEIAGSRSVGRTQVHPANGIIPVRNEMIVLGASALFLVLDTRFAGEAACPR